MNGMWHRNYHILFSSASISSNSAGERQSQFELIRVGEILFPGYGPKIPNHNTQIPNKLKIQNFNDQNEVLRFVIWFFRFIQVRFQPALASGS